MFYWRFIIKKIMIMFRCYAVLRQCPFALMHRIPRCLCITSVCRNQYRNIPRWITENIPNIAHANPFVRRAIGEAIRGNVRTFRRNFVTGLHGERWSSNEMLGKEQRRPRLRVDHGKGKKNTSCGTEYSKDGCRASLVFLSFYRDVNRPAIWHSSWRPATVISSNAK